MYRSLVSLILLVLAVSPAYSQDPQFSQFYAAPLYLNPAYAGYDQGLRINTSYRNQWRDLGKYNTYTVSADVPYQSCNELNMGGGAYLMSDRQNAEIETLTGGFVFVPPVLEKPSYSARMGIMLGAGQRRYERGAQTFMDQLSTGGVTGPTNDPLAFGPLSKSFLDVGIGGLVDFSFNPDDDDDDQDQDWIGISVYHLNQPHISVGAEDYRLPMRINVHAGSRLNYDDWSITPMANFRMQSSLRQIDFGAYITKSPFVIGAMYRGLPILSKQLLNQVTQDAFVGLIGIQIDQLSIGFSYDVTISQLQSYTANTFEVTLRYTNADLALGCEKNARRGQKKRMSCPK